MSFNRINSVVFVIVAVMVFTAPSARSDEKDGQRAVSQVSHSNRGKAPAPANREPSHSNQERQVQEPRREAPQQSPRQIEHRQPIQQVRTEPVHQERGTPKVYAVQAAAPVANNRLFHRQHHKNWRPRYNFYDNQYHFYPYVNIASTVELDAGCVLISFDGQNYYYDQGTFYIQDAGGQYVAVAPPVGIIVNPIAPEARQIVVNGQIYYRYKGVFYVQGPQGYQVVEQMESSPDDGQ